MKVKGIHLERGCNPPMITELKDIHVPEVIAYGQSVKILLKAMIQFHDQSNASGRTGTRAQALKDCFDKSYITFLQHWDHILVRAFRKLTESLKNPKMLQNEKAQREDYAKILNDTGTFINNNRPTNIAGYGSEIASMSTWEALLRFFFAVYPGLQHLDQVYSTIKQCMESEFSYIAGGNINKGAGLPSMTHLTMNDDPQVLTMGFTKDKWKQQHMKKWAWDKRLYCFTTGEKDETQKRRSKARHELGKVQSQDEMVTMLRQLHRSPLWKDSIAIRPSNWPLFEQCPPCLVCLADPKAPMVEDLDLQTSLMSFSQKNAPLACAEVETAIIYQRMMTEQESRKPSKGNKEPTMDEIQANTK
ncbi:MAG: hypothetical protein Q9164_007002 [Protoblastenia rupestris]